MPTPKIKARLRAAAKETAAIWEGYYGHGDNPAKYVTWEFGKAMARVDWACKELAYLGALPLARVWEFGPGAGYLAYTLTEEYGATVTGCDIDDRNLYKDVHRLLGIGHQFQDDLPIEPHQLPASMGGGYDAIVATQACWMVEWTEDEMASFVELCMGALNPGGRLLLHVRPDLVIKGDTLV